jgi:hypothetical protein
MKELFFDYDLISVRCGHVLRSASRRLNIKSWRNLSETDVKYILREPNCGLITIAELILILESKQLKFKDNDRLRNLAPIKSALKRWSK